MRRRSTRTVKIANFWRLFGTYVFFFRHFMLIFYISMAEYGLNFLWHGMFFYAKLYMVWRIELIDVFCIVWYGIVCYAMTLRDCSSFMINWWKSYFLNKKLILNNALNEPRLRTTQQCNCMVWLGRINRNSMAWHGTVIVPHLLSTELSL